MQNLETLVDAMIASLEAKPGERREAVALAAALREAGHDALATTLLGALEHAALRSYQGHVDELRTTPYLDYPRHVHLETFAKCNAACVFCPSPQLVRTGARLDDAVIGKVIEDLTDIPDDVTFQLSPFKVNEPFLDVRLFDVLDLAQAKLPNAKITLTSNAGPLTEKKARRLGAMPAVSRIWISFNDHREQPYEATMKLPYRRTLERLDMLHRLAVGGVFGPKVVLSRVGDDTDADHAFRVWCEARWPAFETLVLRRGDWLGQVDTDIQDVVDVGCIRWFELSITATGQVAHCCMDGQAEWPIGDVTTQHVLEIYNAPDYRRLREEIVSRRQVEPCNACTFM